MPASLSSNPTVKYSGRLAVPPQAAAIIALVRYNSDGSLDTGFDGDGKLTTNFGRVRAGCWPRLAGR